MLRFAIHFANMRMRSWYNTRAVRDIIEKIAITYMKLMSFGADVFVTDSAIMFEWYRFTLNFPSEVSNVIEYVLLRSEEPQIMILMKNG